MPFPEKVRLVVRLQQMAAPLLRARGQCVRVWELDYGSVVTLVATADAMRETNQ